MIIQYVLQTLGFFLQIFPAFLMTFIPFDEESFRYDRKKTVWSVSAALIGVTILFPVLAYLMSGTEQVDINIYTDVYMLILVLGFMGTYFFLIQEPFQKKMLVSWSRSSSWCAVCCSRCILRWWSEDFSRLTS